MSERTASKVRGCRVGGWCRVENLHETARRPPLGEKITIQHNVVITDGLRRCGVPAGLRGRGRRHRRLPGWLGGADASRPYPADQSRGEPDRSIGGLGVGVSVSDLQRGCGCALQTVSRRSHVAWKRELSLTQHAGLELPEALYGGSSLELRHIPSGVRISFCALEVPPTCNGNCRGTPR
jgi:hypothetical protein